MIVFDLQCSARHVFEAWFGSTGAFEDQQRRGLVQCPLCGDPQVDKAVMAPRVGAKGNQVEASQTVAAGAAEMKAALRTLSEMQSRILARADYVGDRFPHEARSIHLGDAPARSIYGKATPAETESLREEGIEVAALPLPVVLPGEEN